MANFNLIKDNIIRQHHLVILHSYYETERDRFNENLNAYGVFEACLLNIERPITCCHGNVTTVLPHFYVPSCKLSLLAVTTSKYSHFKLGQSSTAPGPTCKYTFWHRARDSQYTMDFVASGRHNHLLFQVYENPVKIGGCPTPGQPPRRLSDPGSRAAVACQDRAF
ncbi:hypothetical protein ACJJTC_016333 [Scirpophaga incertulas]